MVWHDWERVQGTCHAGRDVRGCGSQQGRGVAVSEGGAWQPLGRGHGSGWEGCGVDWGRGVAVSGVYVCGSQYGGV